MPRLSDDEIKALREKLTPEQDHIAFKEGTERSGTSQLNQEHRDGVFHCAVCAEPLFSSKGKFESGTGWPSFFEPFSEDSFETKRDFKLILPRTEFHCANCGAHVGHVFKDGPEPTGERWCANGLVLDFRPADAEA